VHDFRAAQQGKVTGLRLALSKVLLGEHGVVIQVSQGPMSRVHQEAIFQGLNLEDSFLRARPSTGSGGGVQEVG
jgi:hypothetical protein